MAPKTGNKAGAAKKVRRKEKKNVAHGHAHIKSTFNNTIVSITDPTGAVISWDHELDAWLNPHLTAARPNPKGLPGIPTLELARQIEQRHPTVTVRFVPVATNRHTMATTTVAAPLVCPWKSCTPRFAMCQSL